MGTIDDDYFIAIYIVYMLKNKNNQVYDETCEKMVNINKAQIALFSNNA